ncbi:cysteine synthase A (chromatophore) [Paulinella micropora]|uniref:Cysteine synthase n=1 Tax=Paulinella micropora TaxID=1928728 RepID=A0A1S6YHR1_9EUKA|nr:cysteine synthase A [Paulinella micropora]BBL86061.1 cysteine synthase A [Paulinella micropora]
MPIASDINALTGRTPLVRLNYLPTTEQCVAHILAKPESFNPTASIKDRIAISMIKAAESCGAIIPGQTTLIEPTSGNTGIALAMVAASRGYQLILTMPDNMSMERRAMFRAYGAKLQLTPRADGIDGAIDLAYQLVEILPRGYILQQFTNPSNPEIHAITTAEEIWSDTNGQIDCFVCGIGTGGTLTGCARILKARNPDIRIIAVEPASSPVISGGKLGDHEIQGIGAGFIPPVLDQTLIDEIVLVSDREAMVMGRRLSYEEGLLSGISSGATIAAAIQIGRRPAMKGKIIVVILASFGERYLSSIMLNGYHTSISYPYEN